MTEVQRPNPDALLAEIQREERAAKRGQLKIFFGMCPGVGKTYAMLEAAQARAREGVDVVVGIVETHGRVETEALVKGLPVIPRKKIDYRGVILQEMDIDAVLARHPQLVLVDELAHTNAPGSRHPKRYQDVLELLDAGIDIYSTLNVQHLESRVDVVQQISGVAVREAVPDSVLDQADEIELVDLTPDQLRKRLAEGKVYMGERAATASENFFREETLTALREMALRQTAHEVDIRQIEFNPDAGRQEAETPERILIHVTEAPATVALIRRGRRVADYLKADCFAVAVLPSSDREKIEQHLEFARKLHIETRILESDNPAEALVDFARRNGVTQIYLAKPAPRSLPLIGKKRHLVMDVVRLANDRQVIVVAERRHP